MASSYTVSIPYIGPAYTVGTPYIDTAFSDANGPSYTVPPINIPPYSDINRPTNSLLNNVFQPMNSSAHNEKTICPYCRGTRKTQYIGEEKCKSCIGTGRVLRSNCWSFPCLTCNGKGIVAYCRYERCHHCNGTGTLCY